MKRRLVLGDDTIEQYEEEEPEPEEKEPTVEDKLKGLNWDDSSDEEDKNQK